MRVRCENGRDLSRAAEPVLRDAHLSTANIAKVRKQCVNIVGLLRH